MPSAGHTCILTGVHTLVYETCPPVCMCVFMYADINPCLSLLSVGTSYRRNSTFVYNMASDTLPTYFFFLSPLHSFSTPHHLLITQYLASSLFITNTSSATPPSSPHLTPLPVSSPPHPRHLYSARPAWRFSHRKPSFDVWRGEPVRYKWTPPTAGAH